MTDRTPENPSGKDWLRLVDAVGAALGAGTNCGSCRPAISRLIEESQCEVQAAAE